MAGVAHDPDCLESARHRRTHAQFKNMRAVEAILPEVRENFEQEIHWLFENYYSEVEQSIMQSRRVAKFRDVSPDTLDRFRQDAMARDERKQEDREEEGEADASPVDLVAPHALAGHQGQQAVVPVPPPPTGDARRHFKRRLPGVRMAAAAVEASAAEAAAQEVTLQPVEDLVGIMGTNDDVNGSPPTQGDDRAVADESEGSLNARTPLAGAAGRALRR